VHVDDVCEAIARAIERGLGGAVNVAEPEPISLAAFLRMTAARAHVRVLFVPLPFAPILAVLRTVEALRLPFPLRSESLLGMRGLRVAPVAADLARLDLRVRPAAESLATIFP
jgi:nucleoside-diphosphate-sugar epimerase